MKISTALNLAAMAVLPQLTTSFDYSVIGAGGLYLEDVLTGIMDLKTIFVNELTSISVVDLEWNGTGAVANSTNTMLCEVYVDGEFANSSSTSLVGVGRELPSSVDCGWITIPEGGRYLIEAVVTVDDSMAGTDGEYEAYGAGVAIIPLCVILLFAVTTHMVEFSLFVGVWLGACIIEGSLNYGFKTTLDTYILNALTDEGHVFVILFTLFLSGVVAMMEKSGGMFGFTKDIAYYARTTRSGQFACFCVGVIIFFDDYANTLLAGKSLRPLLDSLYVSREKLSFIVDATAAPIASISPVSSWVGFEIGLIQAELDKIIEQEGTDDIGIKNTGFAVFLQSIKYRYYPIFMLLLMPIMIWAQRDFASMLIAERKTQVYKRTDGGDSATEAKPDVHYEEDANPVGAASTLDDHPMRDTTSQISQPSSQVVPNSAIAASGEAAAAAVAPVEGGENDPRPDTPHASWNMLVPILLLIFFIFYLLVKSGEDPDDPDQTMMDKIENSDSYVALLYGTMATAMCTLIFYLLQIVRDGEFIWPNGRALYEAFTAGYHKGREERLNHPEPVVAEVQENAKMNPPSDNPEEPEPGRARFLMSVRESVEAHLIGYSRVFPALIVLTLAWASGDVMITVGADRLFAKWISEGIAPEALPTLSFVISLFMALATGTSWGTMTILFPLLLVPTYNVSGGDELIFYSTVAGILSGSVAGDHMSPISDTTVLSSLASDCNLLAHVSTQAPYVFVVATLAIVFGTLPIGYDAWPNMVGISLGLVFIILFVYGICVPVLSPTGRWDIFITLYLKCRPNEGLAELSADCAKAASGEEVGADAGETEGLTKDVEGKGVEEAIPEESGESNESEEADSGAEPTEVHPTQSEEVES